VDRAEQWGNRVDQFHIAPTQTALAPAELSVVVPTFNEEANVRELVDRLRATLSDANWEVVFVDDDSTDATVAILREAAARDPRIRLIHRIGRRGLASAVIEGLQSTSSPYVAVMDADLQHDETILPTMLRTAKQGADIVVGSRYSEGGGVGTWSQQRLQMSRFASLAARLVLRDVVSDPMSGFFLIRRQAFDSVVRRLSSQGFKILLDILATGKGRLKVAETPYTFRERLHGESKLDSGVVWDYAALLIDKTIGRYIPARFIMFAGVGTLGVIVHMAVLGGLLATKAATFIEAQSVAAVAAMTFNFFVNNWLTYRDRRLRGVWPILSGLLTFYAVCAIGAVANVGIASYLFLSNYSWWLAGVAGVIVGAVWNYAASSLYTWRGR
jgi:dolichol-phosphate mannosyltransferase